MGENLVQETVSLSRFCWVFGIHAMATAASACCDDDDQRRRRKSGVRLAPPIQTPRTPGWTHSRMMMIHPFHSTIHGFDIARVHVHAHAVILPVGRPFVRSVAVVWSPFGEDTGLPICLPPSRTNEWTNDFEHIIIEWAFCYCSKLKFNADWIRTHSRCKAKLKSMRFSHVEKRGESKRNTCPMTRELAQEREFKKYQANRRRGNSFAWNICQQTNQANKDPTRTLFTKSIAQG